MSTSVLGSNPPESDLSFDAPSWTALASVVDAPFYVEDRRTHAILYWSPAAATLFGYSGAEAAARSSAELYDDAAEVGDAAERNGAERGIRRCRRADGTVFEAEMAVASLPSRAGACAIVALRARDQALESSSVALSSAPRSERGVPQGEPNIGQLLRSLTNYAVFTTDSNGAIREWNQEASRLFGYAGAEVVGENIALICADNGQRALEKAFEEARDRGASRYYQWMARKDGGRFYARVATFALWNNADVPGFLFLLRDDSREPSLRQILREKEQMAAIGTAASILAHEIGNPLNGISATVQLLDHSLTRPTPPSPEALLSSVQDLKSEVKRMTALLRGFKNIAWPQQLALGPVDIKRLVSSLMAQIEKRSLRQNVEVCFDCAADLPPLTGDDDKLKQALLQVFENALDAMPRGGKLEIKAYRHQQTLCVDIIDTGVGIPKNLKVFDLFSSTKPDGIGLGLFMVQQIVLAHDGAISYSSTPGQGTTFHVSFALNASDPIDADFIDAI